LLFFLKCAIYEQKYFTIFFPRPNYKLEVMIDAYKVGRRMDELGLTQEALADKIGISRRTLNTYLTSGEVKKEKLIGPIADALGVDTGWLLPQGSYQMATGILNAQAMGGSNARSGGDQDTIIRLQTENQQLKERIKSLEEMISKALERK
jgi:transcriptional regulator with XRE-family HTH domain